MYGPARALLRAAMGTARRRVIAEFGQSIGMIPDRHRKSAGLLRLQLVLQLVEGSIEGGRQFSRQDIERA